MDQPLQLPRAAQPRAAEIAKAEHVRLSGEMTVAEAFEAIAASCVRHFRANQEALLRYGDPRALHQARVALRRLRAAISLFRSALRDSQLGGIQAELRWIGGELGEARDLDVCLERQLDAAQRRRLLMRRRHAYERAIAALQSNRLHQLLDQVADWSSEGDWCSGPKALKRLGDFAPRRIERLWRKVKARERRAAGNEARRHHFRILVKKLRYGLEFAGDDGRGKRRKKFVRCLKKVQDATGRLNDAAVARAILAKQGWAVPRDPGERQARRDAEHLVRRLGKARPYWRSAGARS